MDTQGTSVLTAATRIDETPQDLFMYCLNADPMAINKVDKFERTPIHYAAFHGDSWKLRCLIANGADIDKKGFRGETAMHVS